MHIISAWSDQEILEHYWGSTCITTFAITLPLFALFMRLTQVSEWFCATYRHVYLFLVFCFFIGPMISGYWPCGPFFGPFPRSCNLTMTAKHSVSAGAGSIPVCRGWGSLPGGCRLVSGSPPGSLPYWQVKKKRFLSVKLFGLTVPIWRIPLDTKSGGQTQIPRPSLGSWPRTN